MCLEGNGRDSVPFLYANYPNIFYNYSEHFLSSVFIINTQFGRVDLSPSRGGHPTQSGRSWARIITANTNVTEGLFLQSSRWKERP